MPDILTKPRELVFPCCFCGGHDPEADHGLALVDITNGKFQQQWWCHVECLLERMVSQARDAYAAEF